VFFGCEGRRRIVFALFIIDRGHRRASIALEFVRRVLGYAHSRYFVFIGMEDLHLMMCVVSEVGVGGLE
jgi:hypothetical protein